jgi:hypothetical protein
MAVDRPAGVSGLLRGGWCPARSRTTTTRSGPSTPTSSFAIVDPPAGAARQSAPCRRALAPHAFELGISGIAVVVAVLAMGAADSPAAATAVGLEPSWSSYQLIDGVSPAARCFWARC